MLNKIVNRRSASMNVFLKQEIRNKAIDDLAELKKLVDEEVTEINTAKKDLDALKLKSSQQAAQDAKDAATYKGQTQAAQVAYQTLASKPVPIIPPAPIWPTDVPQGISYEQLSNDCLTKARQKYLGHPVYTIAFIHENHPVQGHFAKVILEPIRKEAQEEADQLWSKVFQYNVANVVYTHSVAAHNTHNSSVATALGNLHHAQNTENTHAGAMQGRATQAAKDIADTETKIRKLIKITTDLVHTETLLREALVNQAPSAPTDVYDYCIRYLIGHQTQLPSTFISRFTAGSSLVEKILLSANQRKGIMQYKPDGAIAVSIGFLGLALCSFTVQELNLQKAFGLLIIFMMIYIIAQQGQNYLGQVKHDFGEIKDAIKEIALRIKQFTDFLEDTIDTDSKAAMQFLQTMRDQTDNSIRLVSHNLSIANGQFAFFANNMNAAAQGIGLKMDHIAKVGKQAFDDAVTKIVNSPLMQGKITLGFKLF